MSLLPYHKELGATAACTVRLAEGSTYAGNNPERHEARANKKAELVIGDSWFGSVRSCEQLKLRGHESIFAIKSNHRKYPKQQFWWVHSTASEAGSMR